MRESASKRVSVHTKILRPPHNLPACGHRPALHLGCHPWTAPVRRGGLSAKRNRRGQVGSPRHYVPGSHLTATSQVARWKCPWEAKKIRIRVVFLNCSHFVGIYFLAPRFSGVFYLLLKRSNPGSFLYRRGPLGGTPGRSAAPSIQRKSQKIRETFSKFWFSGKWWLW